MLTLRKNKNRIFYITPILFLFFFFLSVQSIVAATIDFESGAHSYAVDDTILVRIFISSGISVNAVSAKIAFPSDVVTISSISKSSSIVSLWAQEPSYSNQNGTVSLEGVILNGYSGNHGLVATLLLKAKSAGIAKIHFSSASILANDGSGTEVLSNAGSTTISVTNADPKKAKELTKEQKLAIGTPFTAPIPNVVEIKNVVQYFSYTLFTSILLALLLLFLALFILFKIHYKDVVRTSFKKKLASAENNILNDFKKEKFSDIQEAVLKEMKNIEKEL